MSDHRTTAARILLLGACCLIASSPARAEEPPTLGEALTKGTLSLNLRYRYEAVDQASFDDNGKASTLRTALGYRTGEWRRLAAFVEFEDVRTLGLSNDHNNLGSGSAGNGVTDLPAIPDAPITEVHQAYLDWRPLDALPIRGGRQELIVDNARFIGNVGWRQNHQGFDGVTAHFKGIENLDLGYAYLARQRTVTGASRPMSTSHLDGAYTFAGLGTLRAYLLAIDFDQEALWALSTTTLGASFAGRAALGGELSLSYRLELAMQEDGGSNPRNVDADYRRAELGLARGAFTAGAGYELLGGSAADGAFQTPLATLHAFNGWADVFLATPSTGLRDLFLSCGAGIGRWKLAAVYHDFAADSGGADYGSELDASVVFTAPWKQKFALEVAVYDADANGTDTDKLFIWTQWGF
jgi:hypothetical protein